MLNTLILDILELNKSDNFEDLKKNTSYDVIDGISNFLSGKEAFYKLDPTDCEHAFLITDNRIAADIALKYGIGISVYTNGHNNASDFPEALYCIESICDMSDKNLLRMYNRYKCLPWDILETEHFLVREITLSDVDNLYEIYSDYETKQYIEDLFPNRDDEIRFTNDYILNQYRFYEYGLWVVIQKETGKLIGRAGIFNRDNQDLAELGFVFDKSFWGTGASSEVLTAIIEYAKSELGMSSLCAHTVHENIRSSHLLTKLGFSFAGEFLVDDKLFDRYIII